MLKNAIDKNITKWFNDLKTNTYRTEGMYNNKKGVNNINNSFEKRYITSYYSCNTNIYTKQ